MSYCLILFQIEKMEKFIQAMIAMLFIYNDVVSLSIASLETVQYMAIQAALYAIQKAFFIYNWKRVKWWQVLLDFFEISSLTVAVREKKQKWIMIGYYLRIFLVLYSQLLMLIAQQQYENLSQDVQIMVLTSILLGSIAMTVVQSMKLNLISSFVIKWMFQVGLLGLVVLFLANQNSSIILTYFIIKLIISFSFNIIAFKEEYLQMKEQMKFVVFAFNFYICIDHGPFYEFRWHHTKPIKPKEIKRIPSKKEQSPLQNNSILQNEDNFLQHENNQNQNIIQLNNNNPPGLLLVNQENQYQNIVIEGMNQSIKENDEDGDDLKSQQKEKIISNEVMLYSLSVFRFNTFLQVIDGVFLFLMDFMYYSEQRSEEEVVSSDHYNLSDTLKNKKAILSYLRFMSQLILGFLVISFVMNQLLFALYSKYSWHSVFCTKKIELKKLNKFIKKSSKLIYLFANVAEIDIRQFTTDKSINDSIQDLVSTTLVAAHKNHPFMKIKDVNNCSLIKIDGLKCVLDSILHDFLIVTLKTVTILPNFTFFYPEEQELLPIQIKQLIMALNFRTLIFGLNNISVISNRLILKADLNIQTRQYSILAFYKSISQYLSFSPCQILYDLYD